MSPVSVLLMRHAKSSWGAPDLRDHERPLNKRGKWAAPLMGAELESMGLIPDFLCASTAVRAQETTRAVVEASGYQGEILTTDRLYLASPEVYYDVFTEVPRGTKRVLLVAHNPGIADLAEQMGGEQVEMCTAGIAHIECQVAEVCEITSSTPGRLVGFYRPPRGGAP